jgi:hypothetical protein
MSHYCVAVITDNPDNIDKIMEPYLNSDYYIIIVDCHI